MGGYIQSIAAAQYLPQVDKYISREGLDKYIGEKLSTILNGWFMHSSLNWPPSPDINPLFISFHMNRPFIKNLTSPNAISYYKDIGRIGCRDFYTAEVLESKGVDSYYSSCLTTTLGKSFSPKNENRNGVLLVDLMHYLPELSSYSQLPLKSVLSLIKTGNIGKLFKKKSVLNKIISTIPEGKEVKCLEHKLPFENYTRDERYALARKYLDEFSRAEVVVTSRIHCALPCLAMNTPVIYLKYGQSSQTNIYRFRGILDHMNVIDLDEDLYKNNFGSNILTLSDLEVSKKIVNPNSHLMYVDSLIERCENFVGI